MKTIKLTIALVLCNLLIYAQPYFGINGGINLSRVTTKIDGKSAGLNADVGYIFSADINISITDNLLFQSGLQYESIHSKVSSNNTFNAGGGITSISDFKGNSNIDYINIPAKLFFKLPKGKNSFMVGAGPYIGIGISGKSKSNEITTTTTTGGSISTSEYRYSGKATFGSADTSIKRTNIGIGLNASLILSNKINISLYSNIGISNLNNGAKRTSKTSSVGITIGYVLYRDEIKK